MSFAFVVMFLSLSGQSDNPDNDILATRKEAVYSHHADTYVANILTGKRFTDYRDQFKQFFLGKYTTIGTLVYDGVSFEDIELQYNLFTQNVVVLLETENIERYISVTPDKISGFSVYDHEFVHVPGDSIMSEGIYELAYAGDPSKVFIKRTTTRKQMIKDQRVYYEYDPINRYYITNQFGTFHITSKKKLIEAYQNSQQLISIIKQHKIKFSKKKMSQGLVSAVSNLEADTIQHE